MQCRGISIFRFTKDTLDEKGQARDTRVRVTLECFLTRQNFSGRRWLNFPAARDLDQKKDFPTGTFDLKGTNLNVLMRDQMSFVGVTHLTRGGRSCSCALYRCHQSREEASEQCND